MVRRNELACRNAWSASLWEPVSGATESDTTQPRHLMATGPLPPANADEIRAVVAQDTIVPDAGEDVLLSEARLIAEPIRFAVASPQTEAPRAAAGFDPRTALFRAREAHKEKIRAKDAAVRHSESIEPGGVPADDGNEVRASAGVSGPAAWEPSAPEVQAGISLPEHWEVPLPVADDMHPVVYQGTDESELTRWLGDPPPVAKVEEEPPREELALANLFEFADKALPGWFQSELPKTCRTCRDFRPSLEGDTGWCANRWAFNKALGEPQQLVHEDELSPCASPIGTWWAAVDDVWLVAADVSHHSRPTPLMDRYLPAKVAEKKRS